MISSTLMRQVGTAMIGAIASTFAIQSSLAQNRTTTDFELMMTIQESLSQAAGCTGIAVTFKGAGLSPQLGVVDGEGSHCATPDSQGNISAPEGTMTLKTAAGDEMRVRFAFHLTPTATPPVYQIWGTYQIDSATGRYVNASGRGLVYGLEQVNLAQGQSGPLILHAKGTLSY
ncbi:hypothetical protein [Noviherbaspirillum aerium]|uniref:hypothetical protein n=1 Tax=Noviherbaspirillum aerium TaxID=2588497 RepID=UPI00124E8464|nr:hypothetical protein [Noviherbaspirillum aerium]